MDDVRVSRDLIYRTTGDGPLALDLYLPSSDAAAPLVIVVHGGPSPPNLATQPKDWAAFQSIGRLVAASGWVAAVFNHRYFGSDHLVDAVADVEGVIDYLGDNAVQLGIDAHRLCVWVFSGAGRFVAPILRNRPQGLCGIVAYYPVLDADKHEYSAVRALTGVLDPLPPLLLARAGLEQNAWLQAGLDRFVIAAIEANLPIDVLNHPTGRHGFDVLDDGPRTRAILGRTIAFIRDLW